MERLERGKTGDSPTRVYKMRVRVKLGNRAPGDLEGLTGVVTDRRDLLVSTVELSQGQVGECYEAISPSFLRELGEEGPGAVRRLTSV